jgi:methanogenic corrinoid protein MtbC1
MDAALLERRKALAARLRARRDATAEAVTRSFLAQHPDWQKRYGERAWLRGMEDARCHCDFIGAAVETGSPRGFAEYAAWAARVLAARGIAPAFLVENLLQIEVALAADLEVEERNVLRAVVRAGLDACAEMPEGAPPEMGGSRSPLVQALLSGQRSAAVTVAREMLRVGHTMIDVYADLLQEALYDVGRLWESNQITVAQEHMATAIVQYVMAQIYEAQPPPSMRRGRAVITGVQGELHQVGAMMVADALEADGWDVRFLGTDVPHEAVLAAVIAHRAEILGISSTVLFSLPKVIQIVSLVRGRLGAEAPRILLGGAAQRAAPDLWRQVGAVGSASDVRSALRLARGATERVAAD